MKKTLLIIILVLSMVLIGCGGNKASQKLTVNCYMGETLVRSSAYTKENFKLDELEIEGYIFDGWFLDQEFSEAFNYSNLDKYFENEEITVYAKMDKIMKNINIKIQGQLNKETVLNPIFSWTNVNNDSEFEVYIFKGETQVYKKTVAETKVQFTNTLEASTDYKVVVKGVDTAYENELSFKTMEVSDSSINSISISNPFMDNMVIQRNETIDFVGKAPASELIKVVFGDEEYYGYSDKDGNYTVSVPPKSASFNAIDIVITNGCGKELKINNVLIGDVYLFAGQSNMQWPTEKSDYRAGDVTNAKNTGVRFFVQNVVTATSKQDSVSGGRWFIPNDYNYQQFSAIAFMSGAILSKAVESETPIGIITAYQGDTNIANWMGEEYYSGNCSTKYLHYNAMVYPLKYTKLAGVVWYQGCNNSAAGAEYKALLRKLFKNYRDLFNSPNMPYFVIGLCCYDGDAGNNYDFSYVRESQALACKQDGNAYFISTCDDGDPTYIHPSTKRYICERVAKSIQSVIYNNTEYYPEGPSYKSHTVDGNKVIIEFYNAGGLYSTGEIKGLFLAGEDGKYYEAKATINGGKIEAYSDKVDNPVYIKYGFGKSPFVNIFNKDNYAITPFRTDTNNINIDLFNYEDTSVYTTHPDGSKMDISTLDNNLVITKQNDGKTYGSIRLSKWGAIAYQPVGFSFTIVGTNSNASITIRFIEGGSYEIWGYKVVDDFEGERTFVANVGEFSVVYNKQDGIFNPQMIEYVELMIEGSGEVTTTLKEARFIPLEKGIPLKFYINSVSETDSKINISFSQATFADEYTLFVSTSKTNEGTPIYTNTQSDAAFSIDKSLFSQGTPYYVFVTARNYFGETEANNNAFVFYLKEETGVIICNFDFADQASFDAYIASSMSVHNGLTCALEDGAGKIASSGQGWQQFIFKLESGTGNGMSKLTFTADFTHYNGKVVMQLADTNWGVYQYDIDLTKQNSGEFVIDFASFKNSGTSFTTQTLMWVMFNFSDDVGNGYIILDNVKLLK